MITSASNHNAAASDRSAMPSMVRLARNGVRGSFAGPLVRSTYVKLTGNARPGEVMRGGPDVSFGEVWNILASRVQWLAHTGRQIHHLQSDWIDDVACRTQLRSEFACRREQIGRA